MWGLGAGAVLVVASKTRVGPTLFSFSTTHGVHIGDLAFAVVCLGACTAVSIGRHRHRHRHRHR